ncbi:MAG: peptide deformylase [Victivallaceae bacterium]|nr:peptide deformylase [Victivallaceae bacterium]
MFFKPKNQYTVYTAGAAVLKKKAAPVKEITPEIENLSLNMTAAMIAFDGVGLAGPQYGVSKRIVTLNIPASPNGFQSPGEALLIPLMPLTVINPEILELGEELIPWDEGCLSVPDIFGEVIRPSTVKFRAQLLTGNVVECECGGLLARCIQHEIDHLDGHLFVERMAPDQFSEIESEFRRLERLGAKRDYKRRVKS